MWSCLSIFSQDGDSDVGIGRGSLNGILPFAWLAPVYCSDGVSLFCHGSTKEFNCWAFASPVLSSGDCSVSLFWVCTVLQSKCCIVMLNNFSIWMVREGMNPPIYARFYEIYPEKVYCSLFSSPYPDFLFSCLCLSFPVCHRVTDLECVHQKQQLHKHLL